MIHLLRKRIESYQARVRQQYHSFDWIIAILEQASKFSIIHEATSFHKLLRRFFAFIELTCTK